MNTNAQEIVKLWQNAKPEYENHLTGEEEIDISTGRISNVSSPELYIYKPIANANGKAILICPGGGYARLAFGHEGRQMAAWFVEKGFTAIVLKYRMPNKVHQVPIEDGQQAMRYIRENAAKLGVTSQVGVLGFSAGGHLAAAISNHYAIDGISTRPDFAILFYPVITMGEKAHRGSRSNMFGDKPSATDIDKFSLEKQVTAHTPPTILFLSDDDKSVSPVNSTMYYNALKNNDVPSTLYIFPSGGHGWGFRKDFEYHNEMTLLLEKWIDNL